MLARSTEYRWAGGGVYTGSIGEVEIREDIFPKAKLRIFARMPREKKGQGPPEEDPRPSRYRPCAARPTGYSASSCRVSAETSTVIDSICSVTAGSISSWTRPPRQSAKKSSIDR